MSNSGPATNEPGSVGQAKVKRELESEEERGGTAGKAPGGGVVGAGKGVDVVLPLGPYVPPEFWRKACPPNHDKFVGNRESLVPGLPAFVRVQLPEYTIGLCLVENPKPGDVIRVLASPV